MSAFGPPNRYDLNAAETRRIRYLYPETVFQCA